MSSDQGTGIVEPTTDAPCNALAAECLCKEPAGHESPAHACPCGGIWTGSYDGDDFDVVAFPPSMTHFGPVTR